MSADQRRWRKKNRPALQRLSFTHIFVQHSPDFSVIRTRLSPSGGTRTSTISLSTSAIDR
jgi:hypothetical protein